MKFRFVNCAKVAGLLLAGLFLISGFAAAQNAPAPSQTKKVPIGYGLDKDQPFAGADPNVTGLPWREPPREAIEAARKGPTPHLADGHPDLTGFWAPAGWGYAVTQGSVSADGKVLYTQRAPEGPTQTPDKVAELKHRLEASNLPPYKPEALEKVTFLGAHQSHQDPACKG